MLDLLFDTPWWLPTALIGIGLFVVYTGNQRQEKPVMRGGLVIVLLGLLVILTSYLVETDREKVVNRTYALVAAVDHHDWPKFSSLLDSQTSIYGLRGPEQITQACKATAERVELDSAKITGTNINQTPSVISVSIRILSEQLGRPFPSDWQFQYQKVTDQWMLFNIRALNNDQVSEEAIKSAISRP